jgi:hypothetical protein
MSPASSVASPRSASASDSAPSTLRPSASATSASACCGCAGDRGTRELGSSASADELARGVDAHALDRRDRALVADTEGPQPLDLVAEPLDADRVLGGRGEHVDDAAAHGELAARLDVREPLVAERDESLDDALERRGPGATSSGRRCARRGSIGCSAARTGATTASSGSSCASGCASRSTTARRRPTVAGCGRQPLARQRPPRGEHRDAPLTEQRRERVGHRTRVGAARGDDEQRPAALGEQRRDERLRDLRRDERGRPRRPSSHAVRAGRSRRRAVRRRDPGSRTSSTSAGAGRARPDGAHLGLGRPRRTAVGSMPQGSGGSGSGA